MRVWYKPSQVARVLNQAGIPKSQRVPLHEKIMQLGDIETRRLRMPLSNAEAEAQLATGLDFSREAVVGMVAKLDPPIRNALVRKALDLDARTAKVQSHATIAGLVLSIPALYVSLTAGVDLSMAGLAGLAVLAGVPFILTALAKNSESAHHLAELLDHIKHQISLREFTPGRKPAS